jgi:O-antigen/teichoic acid export membrane protein
VLGFLLIPEFGIVGAAIAGAVSRIILNLVGLTQVYLLLKIHPLNWDYFKPWVAALSGLIVTLLIAGFVQGNFIADLSRYGLWFIIYISFLLLLGPKQNEKDMVKYILEKGSRRLKHNG